MRLIDADKLVNDGWFLTRHVTNEFGSTHEMMALEGVPTAYDIDTIMDENAMLRAKLNYMKLRGEVDD